MYAYLNLHSQCELSAVENQMGELSSLEVSSSLFEFVLELALHQASPWYFFSGR